MNFPKLWFDSLILLSCFHGAAQAAEAQRRGMDPTDPQIVQQENHELIGGPQSTPATTPMGESMQPQPNTQGLVPSPDQLSDQDQDPQSVPGQPPFPDQPGRNQQIRDQPSLDQQIQDQQQVRDRQMQDQQQIRDQQVQGQPQIRDQALPGQQTIPGQPPIQGQPQIRDQVLPGQQPIPGQPQAQGQPQSPDQPPVRGQPLPKKPRVLPPPMPPPAPMPAPAPPRPEPYVQPQPSGPKTAEQKAYEASMQTRWTTAADEIISLKSQVESVQGKRQKAFRESLRTASGNRSMAKTKLNQLIRAPSADFDKLKTGVERAFEDLDAAIHRARSHLAAQETP